MESRREVFVTTTWHVHSGIWTPPTDVYETEENLVVKMEVAGMREEDFEVSVEEPARTEMRDVPITRWKYVLGNLKFPLVCRLASTWIKQSLNIKTVF
jgi:hypothetical protein